MMKASEFSTLCQYIDIDIPNGYVNIHNDIGSLRCNSHYLVYYKNLWQYLDFIKEHPCDGHEVKSVYKSTIETNNLLTHIAKEVHCIKYKYRFRRLLMAIVDALAVVLPPLVTINIDRLYAEYLLYKNGMLPYALLDDLSVTGLIMIALWVASFSWRKLTKSIILASINNSMIRQINDDANDYIKETIEESTEEDGMKSEKDLEAIEQAMHNFKVIMSSTYLPRQIASELENLKETLDRLLERVKREPKRLYQVRTLYEVYIVEILKVAVDCECLTDDNLKELQKTIRNCKNYVDKLERDIYETVREDSLVTLAALNNIFEDKSKVEE